MRIIKKLAEKVIAADTSGKQTLYTVPVGKKCIITSIIVRSANASLASNNGTLKFGYNANADDWNNNITDLTVLTGATKFLQKQASSVSIIGNAADVFGCIFSNNSITANVTVEVFGYTSTE